MIQDSLMLRKIPKNLLSKISPENCLMPSKLLLFDKIKIMKENVQEINNFYTDFQTN